MNDSSTVTVIGGGIAGLACAIALQRIGCAVRVFERSPAPQELGAGITLWSNAMTILARWGLADAIRRQANAIESGRLNDSRGRQLIHTPVGEISREFGSVAVGIHRAALLRVLLDAVPAEVVVHRADCVAIEDDSLGVTARFAGQHQHRGQLLIGADGIRSVVFRALHGEVPLKYAGYVCYRGIAPYAGCDVPVGDAFEIWGVGRRFGMIRLDAEHVYWFANENAPAGDDRGAVDIARLRSTFGFWPAPIPEILARGDPRDILRHAIFDRPYRKNQRGRGRVALVGDAAHPMTPDLGQGACQAIEDAETLAQCLASNTDPVAALRAYDEIRWPRVAWIVRRSRFQGWVGQHSTQIGCWLRNWLMRWTPASSMRKTFHDLVTGPNLDRPGDIAG